MGWHVVPGDEIAFETRDDGRRAGTVTERLELQQSRARLWHYPPHTKGRRHADRAQEEVFVVLRGTLAIDLGDPPTRVENLGPESVVSVQPGTPLQLRNDTDEELVLFIYGAPPEQAGADFFPDVD